MKRLVVVCAILALACGGGDPGGATSVAVTAPPASSGGAPTIVLDSSQTGITAGAVKWDGKDPFECAGMDSKVLKDVKLTVTHDPAIYAAGMCKLVLDNVDVTAPNALQVAGMAEVTVIGGRLEGLEYAVQAAGQGVVHLKDGVVIKGEMYKGGEGVINDLRGGASAPKAAPAGATATPASGSSCDTAYEQCNANVGRMVDECRAKCGSGDDEDAAMCRSYCAMGLGNEESMKCEDALNACKGG